MAPRQLRFADRLSAAIENRHTPIENHLIKKPFMKRKYFFVAATIVLLGIQTGYAQTDAKTPKAPKAQQKAAVPPIAVEQPKPEPPPPPPFEPVFWKEDISPVEVLRNNPPKVYEWIETQIKAVPGKPDQFSSREERERYETAVAEKMKTLGPLAFVSGCEKKYDADYQTFEVKAYAFPIQDVLLKEPNPEALRLRKFRVGRENIKSDSYSGHNAYGATSVVIREVSDDYVLAYPSGPDSEPSSIVKRGSTLTSTPSPYRYDFISYTTSIPMLPAEAREKEKDIACLTVVSLEPPYIFRFKERREPMRSSPYDMITNGFAFYGKLDRLWTVNRETGEVYSKHSRPGL